MFAIVKHNNNQYHFETGKNYVLSGLVVDDDEKRITFDQVLLVSDGKEIKVGKPLVKDSKVEAEIVSRSKGDKVKVFKYRAKKRYKKAYGHRDNIVKIVIKEIK